MTKKSTEYSITTEVIRSEAVGNDRVAGQHAEGNGCDERESI
jgi:hypothetical protein